MSAHATVRELSELLDRRLDDSRRPAVESHLEGCRSCRERLAGLKRIASGLETLPPLVPPAELGRRVELGVRRVASEVPLRERLESGLRASLVQPVLLPVLAVILALTVILYVFSEGLARHESARTRVVIEPRAERAPTSPAAAESAPAAVESAGADRGAPGRAVAGRTFDRVGEAWVERGVAAGGSARRLAPEDPRVAPFAELGGKVRLELDGEIVEVVFAAAPAAPAQPDEPR